MVEFLNGVTPINDTNLNKVQTDLQDEINSFTKTVDSNGWTVLDFGTYKEYIKKVTKAVTLTGNEWIMTTMTNLPTGMASFGNRILTSSGRANDSAITCNFGCSGTDTNIMVALTNKFSGSVNTNIVGNFRILEIPE